MGENNEDSELARAVTARRAFLADEAAKAILINESLVVEAGAKAEQIKADVAKVHEVATETRAYLEAHNIPPNFTYKRLIGFGGWKNRTPVYRDYVVWPLTFTEFEVDDPNPGSYQVTGTRTVTTGIGLGADGNIHVAYNDQGMGHYRVLDDEAIRFGPNKCGMAYATAIFRYPDPEQETDVCAIEPEYGKMHRNNAGAVHLEGDALIDSWQQCFTAGIVNLDPAAPVSQ